MGSGWKPLRAHYSDGTRYGSGDPEFTDDQTSALLRTVRALRQSIEHAQTLNAPLPALEEIAESAEALADKLRERSNEKRALQMFHELHEVDELHDVLPYNPVMGKFNAMSPPVRLSVQDKVVIGECTLGDAFEGPPGQVHGGWVAAIHDQVLGISPFVHGMGGFTASITIHYRKPTPLGVPLVFRGWLDRDEGRKIWAKGACEADGEIVSEAEGLFISVQGPPGA